MAWSVEPVSVGQAYLVGETEEEDFVLVLTLNSDLWCTFHQTGQCGHTDVTANKVMEKSDG